MVRGHENERFFGVTVRRLSQSDLSAILYDFVADIHG
jgi:hypothetical protein